MIIVHIALLLNDIIVDMYVILALLSAVSVFSTLSNEQINSVKSDVLCNIAALGPKGEISFRSDLREFALHIYASLCDV